MSPTYLSFLEHAVAEFLEAHASYEKLRDQAPEKRSAHKLAQAVIALHMAIDKAVKAGLSRTDPALVVKGLSGEVLQKLHQDRLLQDVPGILAVPSKVETHHLIGLLHIARRFTVPALDEQQYDEFLGHTQDLVDLRNQLVHKEFAGESDFVITVMTQVLSRVRAVMTVLSPGFLQAASQVNDQIMSRLKAIELEIDGAWQVLVDYLAEGRALQFTTHIWITIPPSAEYADISLSAPSLLTDGISATTTIPRREENGFLLREVKPPPPVTPFFWSSTLSSQSGRTTQAYSGLLEQFLTPERQKAEERVLSPPDDGSIRLNAVPGRVSVRLADRKKSSLGANVLIETLALEFFRDQNEGAVHGALRPTSPVGQKADVTSISLTGSAFLGSEFATGDRSEHFAVGTTLRKIRAQIRLSLDGEPAPPALAAG